MRLVTFLADGVPSPGVLVNGQIVEFSAAHRLWQREKAATTLNSFPVSVLAYLEADDQTKASVKAILTFAAEHLTDLANEGGVYASDSVTFRPPISRPGKIICLGLNYRKHVIEMGRSLPEYPVLFAKFSNTLVGHRQPIVLPKISQQVDYEAELALVVGRVGKDIPNTPEALDYLAGYTIFNDVSVRDYQKRTLQWLQGKSFDGAGPIGPALVTSDEISNPMALDISLRLNGEVMQHSNTDDLIFSIPAILSYISQIMTLDPGDIIATGTPGGVGEARNPQVFLKPGDVVQIEIGELGVLENEVVASS